MKVRSLGARMSVNEDRILSGWQASNAAGMERVPRQG